MKEGWTYKKLGELFPIVMGKTPPRNVSKIGVSRLWCQTVVKFNIYDFQ